MENQVKIMREYPHVGFRYTEGNTDVFLEKQFHPFYELYFLLEGDVEFVNDHTRKKIAPNDMVIIAPGVYHQFIVKNQNYQNYKRCVLNIHPAFLEEDMLETAFSGKEFYTPLPHDRLAEHFLYLKQTMQHCDEKEFRYILSAVATDIVFLIKQNVGFTKDNTRDFFHPVSAEIMNFLNTNYKRNLTLQDVADRFYMSVSSVSHIFKKDFGISIKRYLSEKRMGEIQMCLHMGRKPQEISEEFGFSNYATFYRNYHRHFGASPSEGYRSKK